MKKSLSLLFTVLFILFLLAGCDNSSDSSNRGSVTLTPDTETTFSFGDATVDFPKGSVRREVECSYEVISEYPKISESEQAVTYIHQLSFSDPGAVDAEEHSASITFSLKNVTNQLSIYQYSNYFHSWTDLGRLSLNNDPNAGNSNSIMVLMSGLPTSYTVVNKSEPGSSITDASEILKTPPYIIKNSGKDNTYIISFHADSLFLQDYYKPTFDVEYGFGKDKDSPVYDNKKTLDVVADDEGNLDAGFGNFGNVYHVQLEADPTTNSWVFYKLVFYYSSGGSSKSVEGRFHLAPLDDRQDPISFYAYGDTKSDPAAHNDVVHIINQDWYTNPDKYQSFIVHSGDYAHYGKEVGSWLNDYFHNNKYVSTGTFLSSLILVPNIGNHEFKPSSDGYHPPADVYEVYFDDPGRPDYPEHSNYFYTFTYGFLKIIVLDIYTAPYDPGSSQYIWFESELEKARNEGSVPIVSLHHPAYDSSKNGTNSDGFASTTDIRNYLCPLLEKYGVKLVLSGHRHIYTRNVVNGITHLVLGGGGAPLGGVSSDPSPYMVSSGVFYHFAKITVDPANNKMDVSIIKLTEDHTAQEFEKFTINDIN